MVILLVRPSILTAYMQQTVSDESTFLMHINHCFYFYLANKEINYFLFVGLPIIIITVIAIAICIGCIIKQKSDMCVGCQCCNCCAKSKNTNTTEEQEQETWGQWFARLFSFNFNFGSGRKA